jgi:hypothetical protein
LGHPVVIGAPDFIDELAAPDQDFLIDQILSSLWNSDLMPVFVGSVDVMLPARRPPARPSMASVCERRRDR